MADDPNPDPLAAWAASFLALQQVESTPAEAVDNAAANTPTNADALSAEAQALLAAVDAGGVPAFITESLKRIALAHDIVVDATTTPNDIVAALRARCATRATDTSTKRE